MSDEDKNKLDFYSKLNNKLKMILKGEMSVEDYQRAIQLKIDLIVEDEQERLVEKRKKFYRIRQDPYRY